MRKESVLTQGSTGHRIFPMCVYSDIQIYRYMIYNVCVYEQKIYIYIYIYIYIMYIYVNNKVCMILCWLPFFCPFATRNQEIFFCPKKSQWTSRKRCRHFFFSMLSPDCMSSKLPGSQSPDCTKQTSRNSFFHAYVAGTETMNQIWSISTFLLERRGPFRPM